VKGAKKTSGLTELIERRKRWKQVVGPTSSDEEDDSQDSGNDARVVDEWDFGDDSKDTSKKPQVADSNSKVKSKNGERKGSGERNGASSNSSKSKAKKHGETESKEVALPKESKDAPKDGNASSNNRPSALTSVIYPVLSKLLKTNNDEEVVSALAQLKIAFDNAERAQPGITHTMIAQIIETLKR